MCVSAEARRAAAAAAAERMHHATLTQEAPFSPSEGKKSQSQLAESDTYAHTFQLMGTLWRQLGSESISVSKDLLGFTQMSRRPINQLK